MSSTKSRITDALGIPIHPNDLGPTKARRAQLGLNAFKSAVNIFRHFGDGLETGLWMPAPSVLCTVEASRSLRAYCRVP